ncbi:MAG: hypothetical protein KME03_15500, partial [Aphanocapsa lilacina HA4352-LM1]|nr:hypothetical protein [Aphanocapsa lilacina HA4352-LM1]
HRLYNKLILGMSIAGVNFYTEQFSGVQPAAQSAFQEDRERLLGFENWLVYGFTRTLTRQKTACYTDDVTAPARAPFRGVAFRLLPCKHRSRHRNAGGPQAAF